MLMNAYAAAQRRSQPMIRNFPASQSRKCDQDQESPGKINASTMMVSIRNQYGSFFSLSIYDHIQGMP